MNRPQQVPSSAMQRRLIPLAAVAAVSVLAACGSDSTNTTPSAMPTATSVATPTPTVVATPTPTPTATPAQPCKPGQFDITINNQQGAAGTIYATFEIRNTSTSDCTENGYAHLQMLSSSGAKLPDTWTNDNSLASPGPVDLAPGTEPLGAVGATGHGYFLVWWTDVCPASSAISPKYWQITLPTSGFQTDVTAGSQSGVCGGAFKVGPIKSAPYT
jgi:Protein of unknown function (DUF4232)